MPLSIAAVLLALKEKGMGNADTGLILKRERKVRLTVIRE